MKKTKIITKSVMTIRAVNCLQWINSQLNDAGRQEEFFLSKVLEEGRQSEVQRSKQKVIEYP